MDFHSKKTGAYARTSTEAIENGKRAWSILGGAGWTLNAFVGFWGNVGYEGGYNPWRWQGDKVQSSLGSPWKNKGYGFTQFTNAGKYINDSRAKAMGGYGPNFSNRVGSTGDGDAQIRFVDLYADYIATSKYPLSYAAYKKNTNSPEWNGSCWLINYERPSQENIDKTEPGRRAEARYWFNLFSDVEPEPGEPWEPVDPNPPLQPWDPRPPMETWKLAAFMLLAKYWIKRGGHNDGDTIQLGSDESL